MSARSAASVSRQACSGLRKRAPSSCSASAELKRRLAWLLSTTSGDVDVRSVEAGEVRVETVSGDVRLGVSRGTRVWIDAASVSGELDSELEVDDREPEDDRSGVGEVVPLRVKSVSGDVSIVAATGAVAT